MNKVYNKESNMSGSGHKVTLPCADKSQRILIKSSFPSPTIGNYFGAEDYVGHHPHSKTRSTAHTEGHV